MIQFLVNPFWLFGYDVVFKIVFALITAAVSYYALKVYNLSGQRKSFLLGAGFSLISVSYLVQALFSLASFVYQENFRELVFLGAYLHMIFFIWGVVTLVYMVLNIKRPGFYVLLVLMSLFSFVFSGNSFYLAHIILSLMLLYVFLDYLIGCINKRRPRSMTIPFAFGLLFLADVHFIFSASHEVFYAAGNIIELIAYMMILIKLILIVKK